MKRNDLSIFAVLPLALASHDVALAQTGCTIPAPADHETHLIWGGEARQVFTRDAGGGAIHIHTAEDGGRIRRSTDGGVTWTFAVTPIDVSQSLLDIWFDATGSKGYACGRGGRILKTTDGGATWDHIDPANPIHFDASGEPATLWRVRFLNDDVGFVVGLQVFEATVNGGLGSFAAWTDIGVYTDATFTTQIPLAELELYCLDVLGVPGAFVGSAGAEWETAGGDRGLMLHTNATVPGASVGRKWWVTLDDGAQTPAGLLKEPWDVEYERGATSLTSSRAYVVGGPGGNATSRVYLSEDSGASWSFETTIPGTMYGVAAMPGGFAMLCGYSGNVWSRDPNTAAWTHHPIPAVGGVGGILTAPLAAIHGLSISDFVVVGAWGVERRTTNYGASFDFLNPTYGPTHGEAPWRLSDVFFLPGDPDTGFVCGQIQMIAKSTDGGCTWSLKNGGIGQPGFSSLQLTDLEFSNGSNGIAVGPTSTSSNGVSALWYTTNGGEAWTAGSILGALGSDTFVVRAVSHAVGSAWWAVGTKTVPGSQGPLVLYSRTNGSAWFQMAAPLGGALDLVDVEFLNASEGIAIGNSGGVGRAFRASFNGTSVTWTEIPLVGVTRALRALELEGATLSAADGYIVGDDGLVQRWSTSSFVSVDTSTVYNGQPLTLTVDLLSVALAPDGPEVLIGAQYDSDESNAAQEGLLLRFDGASWECLRANAGYDLSSIQLQAGGQGYLLGNVHNVESATSDHGKVADSAILHYDAN